MGAKHLFVPLLIASMLLVAGCGDEEQPAVVFNESLCPACPACETPDCPACEAQECPEAADCALMGERVELHLDDVELLTSAPGKTEDLVIAKLSIEEYDRMKEARLSFTADCQEAPGRLTIELEGEELYDAVPACGVPTSVDVGTDLFDIGRNTFLFATEGEADYDIDDIVLATSLLNGSNASQQLYSISFKPSATSSTAYKTLTDVKIVNYQELEVSIDKEALDEGLILSFSGVDREGGLRILVNEKEIFSGEVQRRLNEITIPLEHLRDGTNYIVFIGASS